MIRFNPDPHSGGYAYVPMYAVTAVFPAGMDLKGALRDLQASGFDEVRIDVFTKEKGEKQLDFEGKRHGLWVRFMRSLEDILGENADFFHRAEAHLRNGGSIVAVYVDGDDDLKQRAVQILGEHGGVDLQYWGSWTREYFPVPEQQHAVQQ